MKASLIAVVIVGLVAVGLPTTQALRYTVHNTKVFFVEAWRQCMTKGGSLASIELATQNVAVTNAIKKSGGDPAGAWWISGTDLGLEGSFIWISKNTPVGSRSGYLNFAAGEPSNSGTAGEHCLVMLADGTWSDLACNIGNFYVCEYYSV